MTQKYQIGISGALGSDERKREVTKGTKRTKRAETNRKREEGKREREREKKRVKREKVKNREEMDRLRTLE